MKKVLTVGVAATLLVGSVAAASAQAYLLVALGFTFSGYGNLADCQAAGNGIVAQNGSTLGYIPYSYCVPVASANTIPTGGGFSSTTGAF